MSLLLTLGGQKAEKLKKKKMEEKSRQAKVGLNVFRTRYNGIKQGKSRTSFEEDILKGKLNGEDLGDINHSRFFAKDLDEAIYKTMMSDLGDNMKVNLDATKEKRPAGMVFVKMTPNRTTGQIHGVIIPVPENSLTQGFLVPLMLDVPPVHDHSAVGLATSAKVVFNSAGFTDDQLQGIGVDGEYIKKGVKGKLLQILELEDWTEDEKEEWITAVWEPAHMLELTTKDVKKQDNFEWLEHHIKVISDTTNTLGIGKGLEQSRQAAEEVGEKFRKLKTLSDTRFSAYFEGALDNFEKRTETTIVALRKRIESKDKDVKETASRLTKEICSKKFLILTLGLLDVYRLLGSVSSQLQTVEQFPWNIPQKQLELMKTLRRMEKLKLTMMDNGELEEIDGSLWPSLSEKLESVLESTYVSAQTVLEVHPRRGRSAQDISACCSLLQTVENRLTSLCKHLASVLENRVNENPTPEVISTMAKCLDLQDLLEKEETETLRKEREKCLKSVAKIAKYEDGEVEKILKQYQKFKERLSEVVKNEENEVTKRFETLLFVTHSCTKKCESKCLRKGKILEPRIPILFKIVHLFYKEPSLYLEIEDFLQLFLICIVKTHAEGVAESMGSLMDIHGNKRRGRMDILPTGKEAQIHCYDSSQ